MSTQTKTQAWQARFDSLRSNKLFETLVISIIVVSALMIGVKTYPLECIRYVDRCGEFDSH